MDKVKKPFYKKWWFILIVLTIVIGGPASLLEEEKEISTKLPKTKETKETKEETVVEPKSKKIDIDKEIKIGKVNIDLKSVKIEDNKISVYAWWFHGAGREKIHFSVLATMSALQDGEYLKVTQGEDTFLRKTDYGVNSNLDVEYELIDDKTPVEIRFRTTTDDPEEETITIELE